MTNKGEMIEGLLDFFVDSFKASALEMFLTLNGYGEAASDVNERVGGREYFYNVVRALDRRGLINEEFFGRLTRALPKKEAIIRGLQELWLTQEKPKPESPGSPILIAPEKAIDAGPLAPQNQPSATSLRVLFKPDENQGYRAHLTDAGGNPLGVEVPFTPFLTEDDYEDLRWYLEDYMDLPDGGAVTRAERVEFDLERWGRTLHDALFKAEENRDLLRALRDAPEPRS